MRLKGKNNYAAKGGCVGETGRRVAGSNPRVLREGCLIECSVDQSGGDGGGETKVPSADSLLTPSAGQIFFKAEICRAEFQAGEIKFSGRVIPGCQHHLLDRWNKEIINQLFLESVCVYTIRFMLYEC